MQGSDLPTLAYRRLLVGGLSQPRGRVERRTLWVTSQSILNVVQVRGFKLHPPFNFARMLVFCKRKRDQLVSYED